MFTRKWAGWPDRRNWDKQVILAELFAILRLHIQTLKSEIYSLYRKIRHHISIWFHFISQVSIGIGLWSLQIPSSLNTLILCHYDDLQARELGHCHKTAQYHRMIFPTYNFLVFWNYWCPINQKETFKLSQQSYSNRKFFIALNSTNYRTCMSRIVHGKKSLRSNRFEH